MSSTTFNRNSSYTTHALLPGLHSFGISVGDPLFATTQKIKDAVRSPIGQLVIGIGLGLGILKTYELLREKIDKFCRNTSDTTHPLLSRSFRVSLGDALFATTQKITDAVRSPTGQLVIGIGLGLGVHKIYSPLTLKTVKFLGLARMPRDPFRDLSLGVKILSTPFACVLVPILEEQMFRDNLQGKLKDKLESFYADRGFSHSRANSAARVTSLFFTSVIFGLVHVINAAVFLCNPVLFLPQVVAATIMGFTFGLAKEFSGELHMPIGMHIGNNTIAWAESIKASL